MPAGQTRRQLVRGTAQGVALVVTGGSVGCGQSGEGVVDDGSSDDAVRPTGAVALGPVEGLRSDRFEARSGEFPAPDGKTIDIDIYLRRNPDSTDEILALSSRCTHLGCPVRYYAQARLFSCPCHGGAFDIDGEVVGGPSKEPLARFPTEVADGVVYVLPNSPPLSERGA